MKSTISSVSAVVLVLSLMLVVPAHASILGDVQEQLKVPEFDLSIATLLAIAMVSLLIFRLTIFGFLSFIDTFLSFIGTIVKRKGKIDRFPKMSIIIPAYNEEVTVASSIKSMLNLNYPDYEVILIDDGSSDNTFNEASKYSEKGVKVIRQKNTGKPGAINTGIKNASGEVIITVDADSKLHPDALTWIARRFSSNPRLGAVAGNVKIDKPTGLLKTLQSLEYTSSINLVRRSQSMLHCVMVVPGAIAALKTSVLREVGYFPSDTFAEDFDITMKILKAGYHVEYESRAIAFTQAPESVEDFLKQRRRWNRGIPQVLSKYQGMYLNPKYGTAGILGVPFMWYGVGSYLINAFLLFMLLADTFSYIVSSSSYDLNLLAWGMLVYWALSIGVSVYSVLIDPMPKIREIIASPLYLFYNVFIDFVGLMALIEEILSIAMRWDKPKREELE
ncbi:Glycosyltransferase AglE [uncultured archaeon]|nr:Glycosyltransferase AglE [uncultured archaeon]